MMKPTAVLAILISLLTAGPTAGQGLVFVGGLGYEQGSPGPTLVASLADAGLDDTRSRSGRPGIEHPFYYDAGLKLTAFLGGRYRFPGPVSLELLFSNGSRGHAQGYDASQHRTLVLAWSSLLVTSTVGVHLGPIRLGAGPTLNALFWDAEWDWEDDDAFTTPLLGLTGGITADVPVADVVISLRAGGRAFPAVEVNPTLRVPLDAQYNTFYLGLTVIPRT